MVLKVSLIKNTAVQLSHLQVFSVDKPIDSPGGGGGGGRRRRLISPEKS